jgi:hypothetical protein
MTRLLRLYPRAWRDRYGAEMAELLSQRTLTRADRFDLLTGALDAHLHPGLARSPGTHTVAGAGIPARPADAIPAIRALTRADLLALRTAGAPGRAKRRLRRLIGLAVALVLLELTAVVVAVMLPAPPPVAP